MYLGLCLFSVIAAVWAITATAARPRVEAVGPRDRERRNAQLRACPARATKIDVERLLRSHTIPEPTVAHVLGMAAERRISDHTMWSWADRFGADKLILALDAAVAERRLQRHLDADTTPDWAAMSVFAGLNNDTIPFDEVLDLDTVTEAGSFQVDLSGWEMLDGPAVSVPDVDLSQFDHLPPIYNPGLPVTRPAVPPVDRSHGGNDWPQVA